MRTPPVAVGNDIVDLDHPACAGRVEDERFLSRVCSGEERADILAADDPDIELWLRWAAKEAGFKVVTKRRGSPPVFTHARFNVTVERRGPTGGTVRAEGRVRYEEYDIPWRAAEGGSPRVLHLVAWAPAERTAGEGVRVAAGTEVLAECEPVPDGRLTDRERRSVYSPASALVRLRAREHAARLLGQADGSVEIVCPPGATGRTPPRLVHGPAYPGDRSAPCPWDVTLSHHGRLVGWALATSAPGPDEIDLPPPLP